MFSWIPRAFCQPTNMPTLATLSPTLKTNPSQTMQPSKHPPTPTNEPTSQPITSAPTTSAPTTAKPLTMEPTLVGTVVEVGSMVRS